MRIAVISPSVDKRHGTERAVAELIERLAANYGDDIELYAQRVALLDDESVGSSRENSRGKIQPHAVGKWPGPHVIQFLGWMVLNRWARRRDARLTDVAADALFSPGINALDADVILVHAVFHRLAELRSARENAGLRGLHRRLYYALLCRLERRVYGDPRVTLAAVSKHTADQLAHYFGRRDITVVRNGVDVAYFSPETIASLRSTSRNRWQIGSEQFVLLLVGNDWRNKGLDALLAAMAQLKALPLRLLVVGQDQQTPFHAQAAILGIRESVQFCEPENDIRKFYAAADLLVAPSREDSFNLPALEAMACGLPSVVSRKAGVSEWLTHGFDCLLLRDPENAGEVADAIRAVATGIELRRTLSENAVATARKFSWDEHAAQLRALIEAAAKKRKSGRPASVSQAHS